MRLDEGAVFGVGGQVLDQDAVLGLGDAVVAAVLARRDLFPSSAVRKPSKSERN